MLSIYKQADPNIARVLVGNKLDLDGDRIVTNSDARKLAAEHGMDYFETSAKDNVNIKEVMTYIMDKVYENLYGKGTVQTEEDAADAAKQSITLNRNNSKREAAQGRGGQDCRCLK